MSDDKGRYYTEEIIRAQADVFRAVAERNGWNVSRVLEIVREELGMEPEPALTESYRIYQLRESELDWTGGIYGSAGEAVGRAQEMADTWPGHWKAPVFKVMKVTETEIAEITRKDSE